MFAHVFQYTDKNTDTVYLNVTSSEMLKTSKVILVFLDHGLILITYVHIATS